MLVAGKGLGEDATNSAAARQMSPPRKSQREGEAGKKQREPEARRSEGEGCQRAELQRTCHLKLEFDSIPSRRGKFGRRRRREEDDENSRRERQAGRKR